MHQVTKWRVFRQVLIYLVVCFYAAFSTWLFVRLQIDGQVTIYEPDPLVLWIELVCAPVLSLFGLGMLIGYIRGLRRRR